MTNFINGYLKNAILVENNEYLLFVTLQKILSADVEKLQRLSKSILNTRFIPIRFVKIYPVVPKREVDKRLKLATILKSPENHRQTDSPEKMK